MIVSSETFGGYITGLWQREGDSWRSNKGKHSLQQRDKQGNARKKKDGSSGINGVGTDRVHFDIRRNKGAYYLDLCKDQIKDGKVGGRLINDLLTKYGKDGLARHPNGDRLTLEMKDGIALIELARDICDFIEGHNTPQE